MIDSVGYMVPGAVGAEEDGKPRMVTTPWYDEEIPMTQAAELGTRKVMEEHCSIGIVVTTDGSITDIPRSEYEDAQRRAIADMQATGKPFLVIINTRLPNSAAARQVKEQLKQEHGINALIADCQALDLEQIKELLTCLLYEFPMKELHVFMPRWMDVLEDEHPVKKILYDALLQHADEITSLAAAAPVLDRLLELEHVLDFSVRSIDLSTGTVSCALRFPDSLFYEILSTKAGLEIQNDAQLLKLLTELAQIKADYDRISDALSQVKATGYGVVMPAAEEMILEKPEIIKKGSTYGVKLKAGAPSIHMIRVDIDTQISPMVGDEKQSRDLIAYLGGEDPEKLWQSNIFGKSVYELIQDGLSAKLVQLPADVRGKFRGTLSRIVNEGANGLVCLIL